MRKKIVSEKNKIILNKRVGADYFRLALESPAITDNCLPGQFIEIRISSSLDPLLRRPFSIHRAMGNGVQKKQVRQGQRFFEVLYQIVGKGTGILSQKKPGEYLDIIGPLGNGFSYSLPVSRIPILVAGGMGVAPLLFLAEELRERLKVKGERLKVLIGAGTREGILCEKEFKRLGCEVKVATDDGTKGFKGTVTDLLKELLSRIEYRESSIYACGPKLMLKALTQISKQCNIPAQVSLEAHMACGIGACLGCVVNTTGGFKRVCKDGPVFNAEEIIW